MKTLAILTILLLTALQSTAMHANVQHHSRSEAKNYVSMELLDFTPSGIFIQSRAGNAYPLTSIQCDSQGYFIDDQLNKVLPQSARVIAVCNNCGAQYENHYPQPCNACGESKGFEITYIDDGY